jgi:hypothetical protein
MSHIAYLAQWAVAHFRTLHYRLLRFSAKFWRKENSWAYLRRLSLRFWILGVKGIMLFSEIPYRVIS